MNDPEQEQTTDDNEDIPTPDTVEVSDLSETDFDLTVKVYDAQFNLINSVVCTDNGIFPIPLGPVDRNALIISAEFTSVGPFQPAFLPCSCPTNCSCVMPIPTGFASVTPRKSQENRHIRVTITRIIVGTEGDD